MQHIQLPVRTLAVHLHVLAHRHRGIVVGSEHNQVVENPSVRLRVRPDGFDQKPAVRVIQTSFLPFHDPWTTSPIVELSCLPQRMLHNLHRPLFSRLDRDLFGHWTLRKVWGGIDSSRGRMHNTGVPSYGDGIEQIRAIAKRRGQHGYQCVFFSSFRQSSDTEASSQSASA